MPFGAESREELLEAREYLSPAQASRSLTVYPPKSTSSAHAQKFRLPSGYTGIVLKYQLACICLLTWLLIMLHGSNFPVKTSLTSDLVPLWSLWIVAVYALAIAFSFAFYLHPSRLGVFTTGILQGMTLAFSAYFSCLALSAMETHGRFDENNTTRMWGSVLYGSTIAGNLGMLLTSFLLILSAAGKLCPNSERMLVQVLPVA